MEALSQGSGELLGWHDPDENRRWIAENKPRTLRDKTMSVADAVSRFVRDGDYVAFGGFGHVRVPMVLVYEIIRQRKRGLAAACKTGVHDVDLLIGAGCIDRVEVAYAFGHEMRGLSPAGRRAVETGSIRVVAELSNAAYQWRFLAGMMGVPFIAARNMLGTETLAKSSAKVVEDPWSGKPVCLIPAAYPDVAMFHVPRCDRLGNAQIDGAIVEDFELARAARRVIVVTEELIEEEVTRTAPGRTVIPSYVVDAVCHVPHGAHPAQMPYLYFFDEDVIGEWLEVSRTPEGVADYLERYVHGTRDFSEYLEAIGGEPRLHQLELLERRDTTPSVGVRRVVRTETSEPPVLTSYSTTELMACAAARLLEDETTVFVGTGLPILASVLAQRTHAPNLVILFEAGGVGPEIPSLPISVGDSRTFHRGIAATSMHDVMSAAQAGYADYGFLGAAMIDAYGNVNTTTIGDYERPDVRLPGSGGANDLGSFCRRTIILMRQDASRFVEELDFLTTPGYLTGPGSRERAGLPEGTGPYRVVTQLGVYGFDPYTLRLTLMALHPGVRVADVDANTSFSIPVSTTLETTPPPTADELRVLHDVDPEGLVLGRR